MYTIQDVIFGLNVFIATTIKMDNLHRHSDIQLGFFEKGPVKYQVGGQIYTIEANEHIMLWSEVPHMVRATPDNNAQYWLTIPFPLFIKWNMPSLATNSIFSGKLIKVQEEKYTEIDKLTFVQWKHDLQNADTKYQELIIDTFEARFRRFALLYESQQIDTNSYSYADKSLYASIYEYLQNHFTQHIRIEDIGEALNIHPNYAMTVFKKKSGYTINQMTNMMRIHEAQRLLISGDLNITDIAYEAGFDTMSNFYAIFKKYCGLTPTEYRENPYKAIHYK